MSVVHVLLFYCQSPVDVSRTHVAVLLSEPIGCPSYTCCCSVVRAQWMSVVHYYTCCCSVVRAQWMSVVHVLLFCCQSPLDVSRTLLHVLLFCCQSPLDVSRTLLHVLLFCCQSSVDVSRTRLHVLLFCCQSSVDVSRTLLYVLLFCCQSPVDVNRTRLHVLLFCCQSPLDVRRTLLHVLLFCCQSPVDVNRTRLHVLLFCCQSPVDVSRTLLHVLLSVVRAQWMSVVHYYTCCFLLSEPSGCQSYTTTRVAFCCQSPVDVSRTLLHVLLFCWQSPAQCHETSPRQRRHDTLLPAVFLPAATDAPSTRRLPTDRHDARPWPVPALPSLLVSVHIAYVSLLFGARAAALPSRCLFGRFLLLPVQRSLPIAPRMDSNCCQAAFVISYHFPSLGQFA